MRTLSVVKYVANFKDRLFRAGQMAKRNLQESQSKMKVWYDRKTKLRCFEPGVCNTKRFISVQGHAVWNEKCSSNIPKNG